MHHNNKSLNAYFSHATQQIHHQNISYIRIYIFLCMLPKLKIHTFEVIKKVWYALTRQYQVCFYDNYVFCYKLYDQKNSSKRFYANIIIYNRLTYWRSYYLLTNTFYEYFLYKIEHDKYYKALKTCFVAYMIYCFESFWQDERQAVLRS